MTFIELYDKYTQRCVYINRDEIIAVVEKEYDSMIYTKAGLFVVNGSPSTILKMITEKEEND